MYILLEYLVTAKPLTNNGETERNAHVEQQIQFLWQWWNTTFYRHHLFSNLHFHFKAA